jgi:hypothetical protein
MSLGHRTPCAVAARFRTVVFHFIYRGKQVMKTREDATKAALLRAKRFCAENATALASVVDLTVACQRLDDVITSFTTHAFEQDANTRSAKGETEKQRQVRVKLRAELMQPIAEIARQNLRTVPEFKALQLPPRSAKGAAFLASATAMADAAAIHKAPLLERGLPADSLEQFQTALNTLEESVSDREKNRTQRMGATKALALQEKEGRSVLKVLDALVRRALEGNEVLLGTWEGVRAISHRPRKPATTPPPATTPTTAATTAAVPAA